MNKTLQQIAEEDGVIIEHSGELVFVRKCEAEKLGLEEVTLEKNTETISSE